MSKERRVVLALGKEMDPVSIFCVSLSDYSTASRKGVSWYKNTQVILNGKLLRPSFIRVFLFAWITLPLVRPSQSALSYKQYFIYQAQIPEICWARTEQTSIFLHVISISCTEVKQLCQSTMQINISSYCRWKMENCKCPISGSPLASHRLFQRKEIIVLSYFWE